MTSKVLKFRIREFLKILFNSFVASLLMSMVIIGMIFLLNFFIVQFDIAVISLLVIIGVVTYLISYYLLDKEELFSFFKNVKTIVAYK